MSKKVLKLKKEGSQLFNLKQVVCTIGVATLMDEGKITRNDITSLLVRHVKNDDDNKYPEDREYNLEAIQGQFGRVLSVYEFKGYKLYINTYMGNSPEPTCIMLADEY